MKKILVADPEKNVTFTMTKILQSESYDVLSCSEAHTFLHLVSSGQYDLIVVNSQMRLHESDDIISFLHKKQPEAACILIHNEETVGDVQVAGNVVDQVRKPVDFFIITEKIRRYFSNTGFSGVISGIGLEDYLQIFCMNKITKAILVSKGERRGLILIHDGQIIYASHGDLKGENAFIEILSWEYGKLKEIKIKTFPPPNINKDIQHLLFNAAQVKDERRSSPARQEQADTWDPPAASHKERSQIIPHDTQTNRVPGYQLRGWKKISNQTITVAVTFLLVFLVGGYMGFHGLFGSNNQGCLTKSQAVAQPPEEGKGPEKKMAATPQPSATAEGKKTIVPDIARNASANTIEPSDVSHEKNTASRSDKAGTHANQEDKDRRPPISTPQAMAPDSSSKEMILRLHGSNTIGAELGPALVKAFLKDRLHATGIDMLPGGQENERTIEAMYNRKKIAVEIHAHGSSTSFKDLAAGKCDIGMSSRKIKQSEVEGLLHLGDMTSITSEHIIGLDGIAVIVHKSNELSKITMTDLSGAFSGQVTTWKELGDTHGQDVGVYARDNKSGTYDTFMSIVLEEKRPLVASAKRYEANPALADNVAQDPNAIGFTGLPYVRNAKALAVSEGGSQAIYPTFFTVATEDYPISRRLYMYSPQQPVNTYVSSFIDFVLSEEGQKIVQEVGFVDMNIRSFFVEPPVREAIGNVATVSKYLEAIKDAQRLSVNFRFKRNERVLDNRSVRDLDRVVRFLTDKTDKRIFLAGFADTSGDYEYNKKLAFERAQTVATELKARGIAVSNVFSCGGEMPVASNMTETGKEKNRRVEVWLK